jgi:hypothetical protein
MSASGIGEPQSEHVAKRLTAGGEPLNHHCLHTVELQCLGKLVRGGAFLRPGGLASNPRSVGGSTP